MNDAQSRRLRDRSSGPATLISEGCKIAGVITGDGDFLISGEIDGDCDLGGTVTVAKNGLWSGTIKAGNNTIKTLSWYESLGHAARLLDVVRIYSQLDARQEAA